MALRIEANGRAFYLSALQSTRQPSAKAAYEHLGSEEIRHGQVFQNLMESLPSQTEAPQLPPEFGEYLGALVDSRIFTDEAGAEARVRQARDDVEVIDIGMRMEKETILFFSEIRGLVRSQDRTTVDRILGEEREHLKRLAQLKGELTRAKRS